MLSAIFIWLTFALSGKDMEMSCDEAVMKKIGGDIRAEYSTSLLSLATGKKIIAGTPLAFGEGNPKSRIKNVMNYKKPAFWVLVVCLAMVITLCTFLMLNPKQDINLFGTTYQVEEILYSDGRYSFTYTKETAPIYSITADNTILEKENTPDAEWIHKGNLYPVEYSRQELHALFIDSLNNNVSERLDNVSTIYRADTGDDNQKFYLVMQTNSGKILIAVGYDANGNGHVRWLYLMK